MNKVLDRLATLRPLLIAIAIFLSNIQTVGAGLDFTQFENNREFSEEEESENISTTEEVKAESKYKSSGRNNDLDSDILLEDLNFTQEQFLSLRLECLKTSASFDRTKLFIQFCCLKICAHTTIA